MSGRIVKVSGPLVVAEGMEDANMADVVRVGKQQLIGEILNMTGGSASIQVYEETSGLGPGAEVTTTGMPLSVELGPGMLENIYDGIQRPLTEIRDRCGETIARGVQVPALNREKKWAFTPTVKKGDKVSGGDVIGTVQETSAVLHRIMVPPKMAGTVKEIQSGEFTVEQTVCVLETEKGELETTKKDLDDTQAEMNEKNKESEALLQELLQKADDLQALEEECKEQENAFLKQIAAMEVQFNAAKQREWEAWKATSVPATTAGGGSSGSGGNSGGNSGGSSGGWQVPCSYTSITSPFGNRKSPTAGASSYHQGVDLDTGTGDPVYATRAGVVTVAGWGNAAGNYVQINHQDGFSSIYMHLRDYCVSAGQIVSAGQLIGATGATGITTGDHLHFGISYNGVYVNPCNYVPLY